jgi:putative NIF3 family GTP cyclohydrolase 1 type 2
LTITKAYIILSNMDAKELYEQLETDFISPSLHDDWAQYMRPIFDYLSDEFKKRSMGSVCDNTPKIYKVYTAVFPSDAVMAYILGKNETQIMLFVHHPSIWDMRRYPKIWHLMNGDLLQQFRERHISIYNLHVPLDAYGRYSTCVSMAKLLGMEIIKPFYYYRGVFVAEWNRTKLQTKFPIIATEIPHYCKLVIEGA